MVGRQLDATLQQLREAALAHRYQDGTDAELLDAFSRHRNNLAFEALIRRHGPMVWGICRRVLPQSADAEDAFQATFLILVHKANRLRDRDRLASWLYGVALRVSRKALANWRRQYARISVMPVFDMPSPSDEWSDLRSIVDEEIDRLPALYRDAVILCELQGKSRAAAAQELKIPEGTLSSRLATARKMLAERLTGRGLIVPLGGVSVWIGGDASVTGFPIRLALSAMSLTGPTALVSETVAELALQGVSRVTERLFWTATVLAMASTIIAMIWLGPDTRKNAPVPMVAKNVIDERDSPPLPHDPFMDDRPAKGPAPREITPDVPEPNDVTDVRRFDPVPPKELGDSLPLAQLAEQSDRIVVVKRPIRGETEWRVSRTLKGPDRSGRSNEFRIPNGYDPIPEEDPDQQWIVFLRSEDESDRVPLVRPICKNGWFRPADFASVQEVEAAIPRPSTWGKAVDSKDQKVRLGLRARSTNLQPGEELVVDVSIQNLGEKEVLVRRLRYDFYANWIAKFTLTGPDGREWMFVPQYPGDGAFQQYQRLKPKEIYTHVVRLKSWRIAKFDPEMPVPNVIDYWTDWNGRYKLKATFNMSEDQNDRDYWTGEATSNTIEFDVKPALAGPERKLELLRSADAFWISIKGDGLCDLKFNAQTKGARKGLSTITVEQARLLIEKLDESGDLGRAVTLLTRNKNSSTRRVNVGFGFRINRSADISYSVEWPPDTSLVNRLRMLRQCIDGDAATQIDQAIDRIESAGKPPLETK